MLPLNEIEKVMKKVCEDYMKGEIMSTRREDHIPEEHYVSKTWLELHASGDFPPGHQRIIGPDKMTKHKLYLQARNEHYKRNIKLMLSRLCDVAIGLLAGIIYLSAVYYLSLWRW